MAESDDDEDENVVRRHIWQRCGGGRSFWRILGWATIYKGVKATLHANHKRSWAAFVRLARRQLAEMAHADSLANIHRLADIHRRYVERWLSPSAIGDIRMGDEQPRVQPPPRRSNAGLQDEPPVGPQQQQQRDKMITDLLMMEIAAHGAAWPFMLHRGRWRLLRRLCHPGSLKSWVQAQPQFKIIEDSMQRWGITRT